MTTCLLFWQRIQKEEQSCRELKLILGTIRLPVCALCLRPLCLAALNVRNLFAVVRPDCAHSACPTGTVPQRAMAHPLLGLMAIQCCDRPSLYVCCDTGLLCAAFKCRKWSHLHNVSSKYFCSCRQFAINACVQWAIHLSVWGNVCKHGWEYFCESGSVCTCFFTSMDVSIHLHLMEECFWASVKRRRICEYYGTFVQNKGQEMSAHLWV